nr:hypothetical protein HK105_001048 [Polyrhizophydium stewartii]
MAMLASLLPWRSGAWPSSLSHLAGDPLATSHQQDQPEQPDTSRPLAFFVLGDWGDPVDSHGLAVASVMQAMHSLAPVDMVLFLGDNFYGTGQPGTDGVASVDDPKWTKLWLSAYGRLTHIPWLGVLGNHDWNGNIDAQLAYHGVNPSWNMEDLFWERVMAVSHPAVPYRACADRLTSCCALASLQVGSREAAFIFIDTDLLYYGYAGDPGSPMEERFRARGWTPENRVVEAQLKWIEAALQRHADQPWVFVIGHHELGACPASHHMAQLLNLFQLYKVRSYAVRRRGAMLD